MIVTSVSLPLISFACVHSNRDRSFLRVRVCVCVCVCVCVSMLCRYELMWCEMSYLMGCGRFLACTLFPFEARKYLLGIQSALRGWSVGVKADGKYGWLSWQEPGASQSLPPGESEVLWQMCAHWPTPHKHCKNTFVLTLNPSVTPTSFHNIKHLLQFINF